MGKKDYEQICGGETYITAEQIMNEVKSLKTDKKG